ncbi:hypothetical protein PoB_001255500 [Plakobranchus ocellatus]|uniref:Uncharacterized protein n=1 Tax=Plakobranchus ocellatus TaxID=259542 RepID=A0AAV3YUE8_9GAST|nr:hypothetical protein PoB_001255500 [Plakobranchus ocellatus]
MPSELALTSAGIVLSVVQAPRSCLAKTSHPPGALNRLLFPARSTFCVLPPADRVRLVDSLDKQTNKSDLAALLSTLEGKTGDGKSGGSKRLSTLYTPFRGRQQLLKRTRWYH